jgi:hypothetical protein
MRNKHFDLAEAAVDGFDLKLLARFVNNNGLELAARGDDRSARERFLLANIVEDERPVVL